MDNSGGSIGSYARVAAKSAAAPAPVPAAATVATATAPAGVAAAAPADADAAKAAAASAGPQRRRYRAVFKPLVPVEGTLPRASVFSRFAHATSSHSDCDAHVLAIAECLWSRSS